MVTNDIFQLVGIPQEEADIFFTILGLVNSSNANTLTFIDDEKYLRELNSNSNISGVLTTNKIKDDIREGVKVIVVDDPRYVFYRIQNVVYEQYYKKVPTVVGDNANIHATASVSEYNVIIGKNVVIEPNVTILPDVIIGDNVIIRAGTVIGAEGYEHKRTTKGVLSVVHDGKVIIGNNVVVGACNTISKGFSYRHTVIGEETKMDNLVHIAHGSQIGERCFLTASAMIAGSVSIGNDVWLGPNCSISSQVNIGDRAFITIGSVVTKNVGEEEKVTGNFAIPHNLFLRDLKTKFIKDE